MTEPTAMTFEDYETFALTSTIPMPKPPLPFLGLKLAGEVGEVLEKIGKRLRGDFTWSDPARRRDLVLELGDVLWYAINIAHQIGSSFKTLVFSHGVGLGAKSLLHYHQKVSAAPTFWSLSQIGLLLSASAGRISQSVVDLNYCGLPSTGLAKREIEIELGLMLTYLARTADALGYTFDDVAKMNQAKLIDRRARGVSRGEGDNR